MNKNKKYEEEKKETTSKTEHLKNVPGYAVGIGIAVAAFLPILTWWGYKKIVKSPEKDKSSDN
jgi:hypothetical protein